MPGRLSRRLFLSILAIPFGAACAGSVAISRLSAPRAHAPLSTTGGLIEQPGAEIVEGSLPTTVLESQANEPLLEPIAESTLAPQQAAACIGPWGPCDDWDEMARWIDTEVVPLPEGRPEPLPWGGGASPDPSAVQRFRAPLPRVPVWNPPGTKRVGLQAGHWEFHDAPDELASLRSNPGSSGGGRAEWEAMLEIAQRAARMLEDAGVAVDVLPTTVPIRYRAHAFVSLHGDGDISGQLHGYKLARPMFSAIPDTDDLFAELMYDEYGRVTQMPRDDLHITGRMRAYYAFNARRYQHAVAPGVPQLIVETGFMTSPIDRALLLGNPDVPARGIANGVLAFLAQDIRDNDRFIPDPVS